jgi:hypothetical protein
VRVAPTIYLHPFSASRVRLPLAATGQVAVGNCIGHQKLFELSTIGLVVKFVVAIDEPWVRFPDGARFLILLSASLVRVIPLREFDLYGNMPPQHCIQS